MVEIAPEAAVEVDVAVEMMIAVAAARVAALLASELAAAALDRTFQNHITRFGIPSLQFPHLTKPQTTYLKGY